MGSFGLPMGDELRVMSGAFRCSGCESWVLLAGAVVKIGELLVGRFGALLAIGFVGRGGDELVKSTTTLFLGGCFAEGASACVVSVKQLFD
jgi:hypothetical protein